MTAVALSVRAEVRSTSGKGVARALRREDKIPAVIYSKGKESVMVAIPHKDLQPLQKNASFSSTVIELDVEGTKYNLLAKNMDYHPVTDALEHVEFIDISGSKMVNVNIPIKIEGRAKSIGLKKDGVINLVRRYLECTANNDNIPQYISIDVANVNIGDVVRLKDIVLPDSVKLLEKNLNYVILKLSGKKSKSDTEAASAESSTAEKK